MPSIAEQLCGELILCYGGPYDGEWACSALGPSWPFLNRETGIVGTYVLDHEGDYVWAGDDET